MDLSKLTQDRRLPLVVAAAVLVAIFAYASRTETVAMTVTVQAKFGGVFTNSSTCVPNDSYSTTMNSLEVKSSKGVSVALPQLTWSLAEENKCKLDTVLKLPPNDTYAVSFDGEEIGTVTAANFLSNSASYLYVISVMRNLSGHFQLTEKADSCRYKANGGWRCSWSWYSYGGQNFDGSSKSGSCKGIGGYFDLKNGTNVKVYGSDGNLLATTALGNSHYDLVSVSSKKLFCEWDWSVVGVPNDEGGYSVEISHRGKVSFSAVKLAANGYTLDTTIGD